MNGAKIVGKYLQNEGVKYVFGIPGGDLLPFFDALHDETSIQTRITRHEQSAAHMAEGFARMTNQP